MTASSPSDRRRPGGRLARLGVEAARVARSQPVGSAVTALIVAAVCGVILSTTGRTVQTEQDVLARIDDAGTRSITITDVGGTAGLAADAVDRIQALSATDWVIGIGPARDAVNAALGAAGQPVATRDVFGDLPGAPFLAASRPDLPPGTALVGGGATATLGLQQPAGGLLVGREQVAVAGTFAAGDTLEFLDRSVLRLPPPDAADRGVRSIHLLAQRPEDVAQLAEAARSVLGAVDATAVSVTTSENLVQVRAAVQGELGRFGRQLVALVLGVGLVLVSLNVFGTVSSRRRDFGRRRALGATRPDIVWLVMVQTFLVAVAGAAGGAALSAVAVRQWTGSLPDPSFTVAIAVLAVLIGTAAAFPPAVVAAYRDPIRVLRVP